MRKEKIDELQGYIDELKLKKMQLLEKSGHFLTVERHIIELNNGQVLRREKLLKDGEDGKAAIILPVTTEGNVVLIVQPRVFTSEGVVVELPAGYVDDGETYEDAARRELFEETGYIPEKMTLLGSFYQDQGCSGAYNQAFLAEGCRKVGRQHLDGDEIIRYFECNLDEMFELVDMGKISDCQSQLAIERSKQYLKK